MIIGLGCLAIIACALVAAAPTLVSLGVGRGMVLGVIESRVDADVTVDTMRVGWFGEQRVTGLKLDGRDGVTGADLNLVLHNGLLSLALGADEIEAEASGALRGVLREDGSTSLAELPVREEKPVNATPPGAGAASSRLPDVTVRITGLSVELTPPNGRVVALEDLAGEVTFADGSLDADVHGVASGASEPGTVDVKATVNNLADEAGALTLHEASGSITLQVRNAPVPLADRPTELDALELTVSTTDPTETVTATILADATIDGVESGHLEGELTAERLVTREGRIDFGLERITGELTGTSVPTALFQRLLAGTPLVLMRDLGPTVDLTANFSSGTERGVTIDADAESVTLRFSGRGNAELRSLQTDVFRLEADVHPELVTALSGLFADASTRVVVDVERFIVRPGDELSQLRTATLEGSVTAASVPTLRLTADGPALPAVGDVNLDIVAPTLGGDIQVRGDTTVDGAATDIRATVLNLIDEQGRINTASTRVTAMLDIDGVTPTLVAGYLPDQRALVETALTGPVDLDLKASVSDGVLDVEGLAESGGDFRLVFGATRDAGRVKVREADLDFHVTPALMETLQAGVEEPVTLAAPARASLAIEPFDLSWPDGQEPDLTGVVIEGRLDDVHAMVSGAPGLRAPVTVDGSFDRLSYGLDDGRFALSGDVSIADTHQVKVAATRVDVSGVRSDEGVTIDSLALEAGDVDVSRLDELLGRPAGVELASWIGARGDATVKIAREDATDRIEIAAAFPNLAGDFAIRQDERNVTVTGDDVRMTLGNAVLRERLKGVTVDGDLPMTLAIRSLTIPRALLDDRPLDSGVVDIDLELAGGPLVLRNAELGRNTLDRITITLAGRDLDDGIDLDIDGDVLFENVGKPGKLTLDGRVTGLLTESRVFEPGQAKLAMDSSFNGVPSALVDGALDLDGLLVAAVGPTMNLAAEAREFSRNGGRADVRIDTRTAVVEGRIYGRDNGLAVEMPDGIDSPDGLRAELELTPPFRQRLLKNINPVFADIRTAEERVTATVGRTLVPLDGNLTRLESTLDLTIGAVQFDSGSFLMGILRFAKTDRTDTFAGHVEPVHAVIRRGVLTYEPFVMTVEHFVITCSGTVNLVSRQLDVRMVIPASSMATTFKQLEDVDPETPVPFIGRGPIDNPKWEIDPEFLADVAIQLGIKEAEKETGVPIGSILDGIFGKKKK